MGPSILCQSAQAQNLGFLDPFQHPQGERIEFSTPDGISCRHTDRDKPSFSIGAGLTEPLILDGGSQFGIIDSDRVTSPLPVVGAVIRIPFGSSSRNCDRIIAMEEATMNIRKGQELFDLGLISEAEFYALGRQAYDVLMQNDQ